MIIILGIVIKSTYIKKMMDGFFDIKCKPELFTGKPVNNSSLIFYWRNVVVDII